MAVDSPRAVGTNTAPVVWPHTGISPPGDQWVLDTAATHRPVAAAAPGPAALSLDAGVVATVETLRAQMADLHTEPPRNNLVIWTAGNVSARVPGRDLLVIHDGG